MKTYQAYQAESRQAETKLRVAEQQRNKLEVANAPPEKLVRSKKYKLIEKEVNKVCELYIYQHKERLFLISFSFLQYMFLCRQIFHSSNDQNCFYSFH